MPAIPVVENLVSFKQMRQVESLDSEEGPSKQVMEKKRQTINDLNTKNEFQLVPEQ